MTEALQIREVFFNSATLKAVQDLQEIIWVGVSWVCNGLNLNKSQKDTQIQNIQKDIVLSRGCLKFQAGVFDLNNETLALQLDYLPLWLAKISITPTMKRDNPELVERLVEYQLRAKDVLASAFLPKYHKSNDTTNVQFESFIAKFDKYLELKVQQLISKKQLQNTNYIQDQTLPWRSNVFSKVKRIAQLTGSYDKLILSNLYKEMYSKCGHNLYQIKKDTNSNTTIATVETDPKLMNDLDSLIDEKLKVLTVNKIVSKTVKKSLTTNEPNRMQKIIKPLADCYNDQSLGYTTTFRKVYAQMPVCWGIRLNSFKRKHTLNKLPTKKSVLLEDDNLFVIFSETVSKMLEEVSNGEQ